jgi:hypothetical protein
MDAQQAHHKAIVDPKDRNPNNPGSKERPAGRAPARSRESEQPAPREAIAQAMKRQPDLTREDAEEVALVFGF